MGWWKPKEGKIQEEMGKLGIEKYKIGAFCRQISTVTVTFFRDFEHVKSESAAQHTTINV